MFLELTTFSEIMFFCADLPLDVEDSMWSNCYKNIRHHMKNRCRKFWKLRHQNMYRMQYCARKKISMAIIFLTWSSAVEENLAIFFFITPLREQNYFIYATSTNHWTRKLGIQFLELAEHPTTMLRKKLLRIAKKNSMQSCGSLCRWNWHLLQKN